MKYIREAALIATAFAIGTALTSFIALRERDWTGPESVILWCSAALVVAWLVCTQVAASTGTVPARNLAVSLGLNLVLGCFVVYFALGERQQRYWLWTRSEAAVSLLSPRLLPPSPIEIRPYSAKYVDGYSVERCSSNRLRPNFIGGRYLGTDLGIVDVAVETVQGKTVLKILMMSELYNKLADYCPSHNEGIAYVVNGDQVLLEDWGVVRATPIGQPTILIRVTGERLDRLTANRFVLWFRRNPKPTIPRK